MTAISKMTHRPQNNHMKPEDKPVHDWFRFVLSFPPHLVREYLDRFKVSKGQRVLDPFCGTGTTVVECKKRGIKSVGVEANPAVSFFAQTKLKWSPSGSGLVKHAMRVASATQESLHSQGISDNGDLPLFAIPRDDKSSHQLLQLPVDLQKLLIKDSISPIPLHKSLILLRTVEELRDDRYYDHERLAFAKAVVFTASNLHFGPEVGVSRKKKQDAAVISSWLGHIRKMAEDLRHAGDRADVESIVQNADARMLSKSLRRRSVNAVITSPPYPNEKDYTRTTRLESVLLGFVKSNADLRELKQDLVRSNTRSVYKVDEDDRFVANNERIQRIAEQIEQRRIELGKTSGFERLYGRLTKLYFGGMARHFADLRIVLRPGAQLAYVVGDQASYLRVMIRTGQLLAEIAESLGYEVTGLDLFRTRLSTATKEMLREEVLVLRWPG